MTGSADITDQDLAALRRHARSCLRCKGSTKNSVLADVNTIKTSRRNGSVSLYDARMSRDVHQLWKLPPLCIAVIVAIHGDPGSQRHAQYANAVAQRVADEFTAGKTKKRARLMALLVMRGLSTPDIRQALGMTSSKWRTSSARRTYYQVGVMIRQLEKKALAQWESQRAAR